MWEPSWGSRAGQERYALELRYVSDIKTGDVIVYEAAIYDQSDHKVCGLKSGPNALTVDEAMAGLAPDFENFLRSGG